MSLTSGSTWNYELVDFLTASTTPFSVITGISDTTINGKTCRVFSNSIGRGNEYYNITSNNYYNYRKLPAVLGGASVENIYLKDNATVGDHWSQSYPITISDNVYDATITNTITEKGIDKTVKGIIYNNAIHVTTTIAVSYSGIQIRASALITDIQYFYAPKYGLILSINKIDFNYNSITSNTDQQTNLNTADIK